MKKIAKNLIVIAGSLLATEVMASLDGKLPVIPQVPGGTINDYPAPPGTFRGEHSGKFFISVTLGERGRGEVTGSARYSYTFGRPSRPALTRAQCVEDFIGQPGSCNRDCIKAEIFIKTQWRLGDEMVEIPTFVRTGGCEAVTTISRNVNIGLSIDPTEAYNLCQSRNAWGRKTYGLAVERVGMLYYFHNPRTTLRLNDSIKEWQFVDPGEVLWPNVEVRIPIEISCLRGREQITINLQELSENAALRASSSTLPSSTHIAALTKQDADKAVIDKTVIVDTKGMLAKVNRSLFVKNAKTAQLKNDPGNISSIIPAEKPVVFGSKAASVKFKSSIPAARPRFKTNVGSPVVIAEKAGSPQPTKATKLRSPEKINKLAVVKPVTVQRMTKVTRTQKSTATYQGNKNSQSPVSLGLKTKPIQGKPKSNQGLLVKPGAASKHLSAPKAVTLQRQAKAPTVFADKKNGRKIAAANQSDRVKKLYSAKPDLAVLKLKLVTPGGKKAGEKAVLYVEVKNIGPGRSTETSLFFLSSSDRTVTSKDKMLGRTSIQALKPGAKVKKSFSFRFPSRVGTYYFGACVKNVKGESAQGNNCTKGYVAKITQIATVKPSSKLQKKTPTSTQKRTTK